jgi:hypothetical protein
MTALVTTIALLVAPIPTPFPKESQWPTPVNSAAPTSSAMFDAYPWEEPRSSSAPTPVVASSDSPPPSPSTTLAEPSSTKPPAPIDLGLKRLTELGANPYQLRIFGCLAWFESRNDPYAVSPTNDKGLWQIHFPLHAWRSAGRDIFDPIVNAEVAWDIYRESGWRAWSTHGLCGV